MSFSFGSINQSLVNGFTSRDMCILRSQPLPQFACPNHFASCSPSFRWCDIKPLIVTSKTWPIWKAITSTKRHVLPRFCTFRVAVQLQEHVRRIGISQYRLCYLHSWYPRSRLPGLSLEIVHREALRRVFKLFWVQCTLTRHLIRRWYRSTSVTCRTNAARPDFSSRVP